MKKFMKTLCVVLSLAMVLSAFAGCGNNETDSGANFKVAFVCSAAGQNDTGYNKSACETIQKVSEELGVEYKIVEPSNGVPQALETLAEDGYDLIFSLEYDFEALINGVGGSKPIAEQYPDTHFVIYNDNPNINEDGSVKHKNVISVLFDVHEASYLAGYAYVLMNENQDKLFADGYQLTPVEQSRAAGFVGGTNSNGILVYSYGFVEGMEKAAAEYDVTYDYYTKYDAGFSDPAVGSTVAGTFFDNGANIVFADCGTVGDGITSKAKEVGKFAIQVDANLDNTQPGHVVTSVLKTTGVPVEAITRAFAEGKIDEMDNLQCYNMQSGATGITDMSVLAEHVTDKTVWDEVVGKVNAVAEEIKNGTIVVTDAQNGETLDLSAVPHINVK